jgi:hypothetical protein
LSCQQLPNLLFEEARQLMHLYVSVAHRSQPAATPWLVRYLSEGHAELAGCHQGHRESCGGQRSSQPGDRDLGVERRLRDRQERD